jgi:serine/threonine-protein kinase
MAALAAERNLLFGLLALQNGLIDQVQLVAAFQAWTRDKARPLADHLVSRGDLDPDDRSAVEALVARHLKKHGGDVGRSLAAVPAGRSTRESLAGIADPDVGGTLAHLGSASTQHGEEADRTASYAVGEATSDGQRFRVLRPHARGGLGAVFVALDSELHREVALKQILDQHADDPISRQRFILEAEVTGGLEHPGIVPVYGLGTYGDGRPYYTMRFIRGDSLKEAIDRFHRDEALKRDPSRRSLELRKLLRRFLDVCNAIEYAHSRGVLHRDIKPGNVIVGKHGETLVVDWGLAKARGRDAAEDISDERPLVPSSASGTAETLPGSALGTPAYMSPEQAQGDLEGLGPRSDVYSLGATLYCLLNGRPPVEADDVGAVLRAVQRGELTPPRQIDPSLDRAVEAVCLKAMARRPDDRYSTPKALADDIERWMADEPASAYREPLASRAGRWARRHRPLIAGAAVLLITAVVGLTIGTVVLGRVNARIDEQRRLAQANYQMAEANFRQARAAVDEYFTLVSESKLLDVPGLQPLRKELLEAAHRYYDRFVRERSGDRRVRGEQGKAVFRVGLITDEIVGRGEALAFFDQARLIQVQLVHDDPQCAPCWADLAETLWHLGDIQRWIGRLAAALDSHRQALEIRQKLIEVQPAEPDHRRNMAQSEAALAELLSATGRYREGLEHAERAVAAGENLIRAQPASHRSRSELVTSRRNQGALLTALARWEDAAQTFRRALAIQEELVREAPRAIKSRSELAWILSHLGSALNVTGKRDEGLSCLQRAMEIRRQLVEENPDVFQLRHELSGSYLALAGSEGYAGRHAEALIAAQRASELQREVVRRNPDNVGYRGQAADCDLAVGWWLLQTGRHDEAKGVLEAARDVLDELLRQHPDDIGVRWGRDDCYGYLRIYYKFVVKDLDEALRYARHRLASAEYLARLNAGVLSFQWAPSDALHDVGILERETGHPEEGLVSLQRALEIKERLTKTHPELADLPGKVSTILTDVGITLRRLGRPDEALESFLRSARLIESMPRKSPYNYYSLTCAYAQTSAVARPEGSRARETVEEVRRSYADRAVASLRLAIELGFIDLPRFRNEVDLDPIRSRDDFRLILLDLAFPADPFAR